jgi:20S proteasome alpha/beta subunit
MDLQQFYSGGQQRLIQMLAGSLDEQVSSFNYGVELLIAGTDESGAHLHSIANPGGSNNDFHQIGFHAIGSGMLHALQSVIGFGHTGKKPLGETIYAVYASKRRAEVAPGVGHDTDLAVITDSGTEWATSKQLDVLRGIYDKHQKAADEQLKKEIAQLDILKKPEVPKPETPKEGGDQK